MRIGWLVFVLCMTAPAAAQEMSDPIANHHFHMGLSAFEQNDYETAAKEFELAYNIEPTTVVLWSWAQAERMGHHCRDALPLYRKFLGASQSASQIKYTTELIDECERALPPRWYTSKLGGGLAGGGVVAVGLGITFFVLSGSSHDAAAKAMYLDDFQAKLDDATTYKRLGGVSLALGVGLLVGGAVVYAGAYKTEHQIIAGTDGRSLIIGARF